MSRLSLWLFRMTFRRSLERGYYWLPMRAVFLVIHEEMRREYFEDNHYSSTAAMQEQFDIALKEPA